MTKAAKKNSYTPPLSVSRHKWVAAKVGCRVQLVHMVLNGTRRGTGRKGKAVLAALSEWEDLYKQFETRLEASLSATNSGTEA